MKKSIRQAALVALLVGATATPMFVASVPVYAADKPKAPSIGAKVGKPLIDGQKAYNANDAATALAKAQEADAVMPKTPFEEYQVAKLLGLIYVKQNDLANAAVQFDRAVGTGGMPDEEKPSILHTAMLLDFNAKNYAKTIQIGTELAMIAPLDDQGALVMTQAYYFSNDFAGAQKYAQGVVAATKAAGMKPSKDILETLINSQLKQNDQAGARQTLEDLVLVEPTPENWGRVIDGAFTGSITDHQALNLFRLRMLTNSMGPQDYAAMASIDLKLGLPGEAKTVLQKGATSGAANTNELMTQANAMATKDQASLPALEKVALAAKDGETDVKLGESYWAYGRGADAETAIKRGIMKGGLKDPADAQLTLGIVLMSEGKKDEAKQAFAAASQAANGNVFAHVWGLYAQS